MKKLTAFLILLGLILYAPSCQRENKSNASLIQKAKESHIEYTSLKEQVNAPSQYKTEFMNEDESQSVEIEATVTVPETDIAAVYRVSDGTISQEQANILIQSLVHTTLYDPYDADISMSGQFKTTDNLSLIEGQGTSDQYGFEGIQIQNGTTVGLSRALYTQNKADDGFSMHYELAQNISRFNYPINLTEISEISITEAEAKRLCDELILKLNISDMSCYSILKKYGGGAYNISPRCCWVLQYTRCLNGVPITYTSSRGDSLQDVDPYEPWSYEILTLYVNDNGIIGLWWESPYILESLLSDPFLMSFSDIMEIFKTTYAADNEQTKRKVVVNEIRFGYARISVDESGSKLLVPAWDFFGETADESGHITDDPETSLYTINAIDGSIIDRDFG